MAAKDTVALIEEAFIGLVRTTPLEKVSVSDIVAASGKNRKTFYYHFEGKSQLVRRIFREDLAAVLRERFDEGSLVYERQREGAMPDLPHYVFIKAGVRSLDGAPFLRALADCLQGRRDFYAKALRQEGPEGLSAYLYQLYVPALEADVRFVLSNRSLPDDNARFLAQFYAGAVIAYLVRRVCDPSVTDLLADAGPFANIVHSSIENEIKEQQFRRVL